MASYGTNAYLGLPASAYSAAEHTYALRVTDGLHYSEAPDEPATTQTPSTTE